MTLNEYDVRIEYKGDVHWYNTRTLTKLEAEREALHEFRASRRLSVMKVPDSEISVSSHFICNYDPER